MYHILQVFLLKNCRLIFFRSVIKTEKREELKKKN